MLKANKREIALFFVILALCAVLITQRGTLRDAVNNLRYPNQLVIETWYARPQAECLTIRRGKNELLELPQPFDWQSGATAAQVFELFGAPQHSVDFMGGEILLWEKDVRYDWDYDLAYSGSYLAIEFNHRGHLQKAVLYGTLPINAKPWGDRTFEELSKDWISDDSENDY